MGVLLSCGFDAKTADFNGMTPLQSTCLANEHNTQLCCSHRREVCQALLDNGADLFAERSNELTPISIAQDQKDYPLMTLFLEHALTQGGYGAPVRFTRMIESIVDIDEESRLCRSATALIGGVRLHASLVKQAVDEGEWDFVMTCIAVHFVSRACLREMYPDMEDRLLDILRMCCATRDHGLVEYIIRPGSLADMIGPRRRECIEPSKLSAAIQELCDMIQISMGWIVEADDYGKRKPLLQPPRDSGGRSIGHLRWAFPRDKHQ